MGKLQWTKKVTFVCHLDGGGDASAGETGFSPAPCLATFLHVLYTADIFIKRVLTLLSVGLKLLLDL